MRNAANSWEHVSRGKHCGRHELESTFHSETGNISRHPKLRGRMDLLSAVAESGRRLPGRQSKISELEVSSTFEDSPSWRTGQRMLESTRLDTLPPNGSSVEDTSCLGRFWTRSRAANWHRWTILVEDAHCLGHFWTRGKVANWHRWSCQNHSPKFGRRMSWLWAARRAFEPMDASHRFRRSPLAGVRAGAHTHGIVNGELVHV